MKQTSLILILALTYSILLEAQTISPIEMQILKTVENNNDEAISKLIEIVNINSGTLNKEGVKKVGTVLKTSFEDIGFKTVWIDMPEEMNRAGHLFAETNGTKGKRILLIGHLDTVFEKNDPLQEFKMVNDSIAIAPGGSDMKGGDIILLYALKALKENDLLNDAQIIAAFTGDEESSGNPKEISRKDLIDAAKRSDVALCFETSTGFNYATVARRGASGWKLEVEAKAAHSSGIFNERVGVGAIYEISRILNEFYVQLKDEPLLTFNPGIITGGTDASIDETTGKSSAFGKSNIVAKIAYAEGDLRFISEEQKNNAREKMKTIVANNLPHTTANITFEDGYPSMAPTEGNYALLAILNQISLDLDLGKVLAYDPGKRGAADTSFVAEYVDCLDGLGAMGSGAHTAYETINLKTFEVLTKRAALLIYRILNSN
jgi:glutamate carboxypeptidase